MLCGLGAAAEGKQRWIKKKQRRVRRITLLNILLSVLSVKLKTTAPVHRRELKKRVVWFTPNLSHMIVAMCLSFPLEMSLFRTDDKGWKHSPVSPSVCWSYCFCRQGPQGRFLSRWNSLAHPRARRRQSFVKVQFTKGNRSVSDLRFYKRGNFYWGRIYYFSFNLKR